MWVAENISIWIIVGISGLVFLGFRVLNWVWLRPKRLENYLRNQGLAGNSYRFFYGDTKEATAMLQQANSKPMNFFSHDIAPRLIPFVDKTVKKYGKNSFTWVGPHPRINIMEPEQVKIALSLFNHIQKPNSNPFFKLLFDGLFGQEGPNWVKHRKLINPAFHLQKLKDMVPVFFQSCNEMICEWENLVCEKGSCELDVLPYLQTLAADIISRTAFGSNYEEGNKIFKLQMELGDLVLQVLLGVYIPGWRFLPTKMNNRMKRLEKEIKALLFDIINKRQRVIQAGEATNNDLLGILMESNFKGIQGHGNKDIGILSIEDVIEECKLFYLAGQGAPSTLLTWTMVLLSSHTEWQERARAEVLEAFDKDVQPDFDGLSRLKVINMILNEVLRLYPPEEMIDRSVQTETKLGNLRLPAGVMLSFPVVLIHHDHKLWGEDADEFKPERFSEGVSKATKNQVSFFPFGWGPRICIGQNFAMIEVKIALSVILQHFSFELSSSYTHSPSPSVTTRPKHGAHIILRKL